MYGLSPNAGKLVSLGTLRNYLDPQELGETATTVPIWGYKEFSSVSRGQPNGWWQLGAEAPFYYAKMSGRASNHVSNPNAVDEALFPQQTMRACPVLSLDSQGRLSPVARTTPGQAMDVHGTDGEYAQLARRQLVYLSRACTDISSEFDDVLEGADAVVNQTCRVRVEGKLEEAEGVGLPYIAFRFGNHRDLAVRYYGDDKQDSMNLRDWEGLLEVVVYNVSTSERATAVYSSRSSLQFYSTVELQAQDALSLANVDREVDADIMIYATSISWAIHIPVNALPPPPQ